LRISCYSFLKYVNTILFCCLLIFLPRYLSLSFSVYSFLVFCSVLLKNLISATISLLISVLVSAQVSAPYPLSYRSRHLNLHIRGLLAGLSSLVVC
jgi:hypothetical protein